MNKSLRLSIATSSEFPEQQELRDSFRRLNANLNNVLPVMLTKLELLDQLDLGTGHNNSLLFDIVNQLKSLDQTYLSSKWKSCNQSALTAKLIKLGEVDIQDGLVFSKRGARKTEIMTSKMTNMEAPRRMSFAATKYRDASDIFHILSLETMTDLQWIFYLNAYYLPYCGLTEGRSMYEHMISTLMKDLTMDERYQTRQAVVFKVLQETICPLHIMVEFTVSLVECVLEMITLINGRIKTAPLNIGQNLDLPDFNHPTWEHLMACFQSNDKIYHSFRKRKLLLSANNGDSSRGGDISWTSKISDFHEGLLDALDLYDLNCKTFAVTLRGLKIEISDFRQIEVGEGLVQLSKAEDFVSKILILNIELQNLIEFFRQGVYEEFYQSSYDILELLEQLQEKYPIVYGGTVTPRTLRPIPLRKSSASDSPRNSDTEGSKNNSPRITSPKNTSSNGIRLSSSGGLLNRWSNSLFGK